MNSSSWPTRALRDCGVLLTGGTPTRSEGRFWGGAIPWISAKSLKTFDLADSEDRLTEDGATQVTVVPRGSVLFVVRGMSLANEFRVGTALRDVTFNQDLRALIPAPDVDGRYLARFLQASSNHVLSMVDEASHGTKRLTSDRFERIDVPLPPILEQRRIAEILDKADALRAKRRAAIAQLDTLTQTILVDMFGDNVFEPSTKMIGQVAEVQGGLQVTSARKNLPREVPYLRVANVYRGRLDLSEIKTIRAVDAEIARTALRPDDFLIVEGHGNPGEVGRGALWDGSIPDCVHQNHLIRVRFDTSRIVPRFASEFLNSATGRRYLLRAGNTTSGLNTISVADVRATPLPVPPISLQREFARRADDCQRLRMTQVASLKQLDALFASLQHRAFRGESVTNMPPVGSPA